jgi:excisionase family DNA binding protein
MTPEDTPSPEVGEAADQRPVPRISYSPREFALMTGLNYQTVLASVRRKEIPADQYGKQYRIPAWYVRRRIEQPAPEVDVASAA